MKVTWRTLIGIFTIFLITVVLLGGCINIYLPDGEQQESLPEQASETPDFQYNETAGEPAETDTVAVGQIYAFGGYDWDVLAIEDGRAFLITHDVINILPVNEYYNPVKWETCVIRKWLNEGFLDGFTPQEIARIVVTQVVTPVNPWLGTDGGATTNDRVFLLSLDEIIRYYGFSKRIAQEGGFEDINDYKRVANLDLSHLSKEQLKEAAIWHYNCTGRGYDDMIQQDGQPYWWWSRSAGYDRYTMAEINDDGAIAYVGLGGGPGGGVRPALYLTL